MTTAASSPGQHPVHYAPATPAFRFHAWQRGLIQGETEGRPNGLLILSPQNEFDRNGPIVAMPNDPPRYQRILYASLRELDGMGLRAIYIEVPPLRPEWAAVRDRIIRATQPLPPS